MNPMHNHAHNKRPRPIDSPRGPPGPPGQPSPMAPYGYPQPDMYIPSPVPLPSSPTAMQSAPLAPGYMPHPPTSSPYQTGGGGAGAGAGPGSSSSSFRNVSACNRCRLRKNRCDQNLPACSSCEKARVKCVGYDPITKREIPRAYVYYLERRVGYLEGLLRGANIQYAPPEDFDVGPEDAHSQPAAGAQNAGGSTVIGPVGAGDIASRRVGISGQGQGQQNNNVLKLRERSLSPVSPRTKITGGEDKDGKDGKTDGKKDNRSEAETEADNINKLVNNISLVSVQGASDPRFLGSASGISFARIVFAAVRSSISGASGDARNRQGAVKGPPSSAGSPSAREGGGAAAAVSGSSMRDSFFGLQSRPAFKKAPFPNRGLASRLIDLYFEHANPQIPILHRDEFSELFEKAFAAGDQKRTARDQYLLNIVFAIGASIFLGRPDGQGTAPKEENIKQEAPTPTTPAPKRFKFERPLVQPEEYHASAMANLEGFLNSTGERPEGFGGALEELQAVLLLAEFALHRPVAPGLWYIVGVAIRLAVDLGLHHEDGTALEDSTGGQGNVALSGVGFHPGSAKSKERGRREWVRDLRRRLWWCVYSFDRLVSTCVGRPFGITDLVVTTEFPSILDDKFITKTGFTGLPDSLNAPSYKIVSHHYFRLRLLQSEILQVLQHRTAQQARLNRMRKRGPNDTTLHDNLLTDLQTPFLQRFDDSFGAWRKDVDRRLYEWKEDSPSNARTSINFTNELLELNYWQTVIMLYRHSLSAPSELQYDISSVDEVTSPMPSEANRAATPMDDEETEDEIYLKVAEAGQNVLKLYRQLHRVRLVNYTFLATHHLFMAGIAFLYALWHSKTVRSLLTFDDVDFTVLAATSVLTDLIETCPPAEACRDAFDRMAKATVTMCFKTTGFGSALAQQHQAERAAQISQHPHLATPAPTEVSDGQMHHTPQLYVQDDNGEYRNQRPRPHFDMNLRELFPEETPETQQFRRVSVWQVPPELGGQQQQQHQQQQQQPMGMPNMNFGAEPIAEFHGSPEMQQAQAQQQQQQQALLAHLQQQQQNAIPIHHAMAGGGSAFPGNNPNFVGPGGNNPQGFDANLAGGFQSRNEMETILADDANAFSGQPGLSLGYSNEHDWNEGTGVDIFDGYFFGGWNGGGGAMPGGPMPGGPQPGMGPVGMGGPQQQAMDISMDENIGPRDM